MGVWPQGRAGQEGLGTVGSWADPLPLNPGGPGGALRIWLPWVGLVSLG